MMQMVTGLAGSKLIIVMRREKNSLKPLEALHKIHKIPACAASYRMGWEGLQADELHPTG
jgi:hypothetical protein